MENIMSLALSDERVSLKTDAHGVVRVAGTRVTLDTIIAAFKEGATAEEIVYRYPTLHLADVYSVLSDYLRRPGEIEAYLHERQQKSKQIRRKNEVRFDLHGIRKRLLARQTRKDNSICL